VSDQFRILHDKKLYDLHTSPGIVRIWKSGALQWGENEKECIQNFDQCISCKWQLGRLKWWWEVD